MMRVITGMLDLANRETIKCQLVTLSIFKAKQKEFENHWPAMRHDEKSSK